MNVTLTTGKQELEKQGNSAGIKNKPADWVILLITAVKPEVLPVNRTSNIMNALQGKVAGLNISLSGHRAPAVLQRSVSEANPHYPARTTH